MRVAVFSTGKIGAIVAQIMKGFGCHLLAYDPFPNPECEALGARYVSLADLFAGEEEADLFFEDLSNRVMQDDAFARLLTFPNVIITGHQGFFTLSDVLQPLLQIINQVFHILHAHREAN